MSSIGMNSMVLSTRPAPNRVLVKCGGFSTQLARHVGDKIDGDPLWGSRFDATNPTAVVQTHLDFLLNGAQILLSNTYQSSVKGFMQHLGLSREESIQLMRKSVKLAKEAKAKYEEIIKSANGTLEPGLPIILASIGPYGAHLHDGSEYSGSYADFVSKEMFQQWHRVRIDACLAEGVDGLAIETIPCQKEAEAVVDMLLDDYPEVKFWVSFQCKDGKTLAHGEDFAQAAHSVWRQILDRKATGRFYGLGVNCVHPRFVSPLFKSFHERLESSRTLPITSTSPTPAAPPLIVYSNRGEVYDSKLAEWTGREKCIPLETYVPEWLQLGVRIVGGCCRVYPEDILQIRKCIDNIGNNN